jgi:UDPglucose 6-dehydrogenase
MAHLGHDVVGIDVDAAKVELLSAGRAPFFEPGFEPLLSGELAAGRLRFSTDLADAADAQVHFVAVGTPQLKDGDGADLRFVDAAVTGLLPHLAPGSLVAGKSTVPVGTAERLAALVEPTGAKLAWNPEFLREGFAVKDTLTPDRIVYGVRDGDRDAVALLDEVYATPIAAPTPRLVTDRATAELVKVAANAFLATKISFINAMAEIAEVTGADVTQLADAIGHDARIGRRFLNAGLGFGGGCLPKDIRAFAARAEELGVGRSVAFLREVDQVNLRRRQRVVDLVESTVGDLAGARVALLGLAFKPDSDDVRDAPGVDVATRLLDAGATVVAIDPEANDRATALEPRLQTVETVEQAVEGADAIVVATEWTLFRELDPAPLAGLVAGRTVIDGRNCLDPAAWRAAGFTYLGMGRP